jgi:hypothetical protein
MLATGNYLYIKQVSLDQYKNYVGIVLYYGINAGFISLNVSTWHICSKQEPTNQAETAVTKERLGQQAHCSEMAAVRIK